ncbi:MAG: alpha/beta fold hydrolase [Clostridia bacterium]|nr:alpha/beta fold hydrolase [Clostridia bacterium]
MQQVACLLIHGVAGGRYQMQKLKEKLEAAGIFAEAITIKGHEATKKELVSTKYYEWLSDANRRYLELCAKFSRVFVVGFSMGGLLALNLARRHRPAGLILVNCPFFCVNLPRVAKNILSDFRTLRFQNIRRYYASEKIPVKTLGQLKNLLEYTKLRLCEISTPALILQCDDDDVVIPKSADYLYEHIKSKDKTQKRYTRGGHEILMGDEADGICDDIVRYVSEKMNTL